MTTFAITWTILLTLFCIGAVRWYKRMEVLDADEIAAELKLQQLHAHRAAMHRYAGRKYS